MTASSQPEEARELVAAAKRDQHALVILSRDAQAPAEIALFLAQQAIEKAIKSVFAMRGVVYRRTHDLLLLETLANEAGITLPVDHEMLPSTAINASARDTSGAACPTYRNSTA